MTSSADRPSDVSPLVDWFSRHGVKAVGALLLIELLFHLYAIASTKRREGAEAAPPPAVRETPSTPGSPSPSPR